MGMALVFCLICVISVQFAGLSNYLDVTHTFPKSLLFPYSRYFLKSRMFTVEVCGKPVAVWQVL